MKIKEKLKKDLELLKRGEVPEPKMFDLEKLNQQDLREINELLKEIISEGEKLQEKLLTLIKETEDKKKNIKSYLKSCYL